MELKINQNDLNRIMGKLNTVAQRAPNHRWPFIVELLTSYGAAVATAMGSVDGYGGEARITLHGLDGYTKTENQKWPALSPYTMAKKIGHTLDAGDTMKDIYYQFADAVKIWHYTGDAQGDVYDSVIAVQGGGSNFVGAPGIGRNFVGIDNYPYAAVVELGDPERKIPKRPLFTVLNDMLRVYVQRELRKERSGLQKRIRQELVELARECGWGNG